MANVFLTPNELKGKYPIPKCCVVCGHSRAKLVRTEFSLEAGRSYSFWTRTTTTTIRTLKISLPLCSEHKSYFADKQRRMLFIVIGLVAFFLLAFAVAVIGTLMFGGLGPCLIVPIVLLGFVGIIGVAVFASIQAKSGVHLSLDNAVFLVNCVRFHPSQVGRARSGDSARWNEDGRNRQRVRPLPR